MHFVLAASSVGVAVTDDIFLRISRQLKKHTVKAMGLQEMSAQLSSVRTRGEGGRQHCPCLHVTSPYTGSELGGAMWTGSEPSASREGAGIRGSG